MSTPQQDSPGKTAYPQAAMELWLKWLAATAAGYLVCATVGLALAWLFVAFQPVPLFEPYGFSAAEFNPNMDSWRQIWNLLLPFGFVGWIAIASYILVHAQHLVMKPGAPSNKRLERVSIFMEHAGLFIGLFLLLGINQMLPIAPAMTVLVIAFLLGLFGGRVIDLTTGRLFEDEGTKGKRTRTVSRMLAWALALPVYVLVYVALGGAVDVESTLRLEPVREIIIALAAGGAAILIAEGIRGAVLIFQQ